MGGGKKRDYSKIPVYDSQADVDYATRRGKLKPGDSVRIGNSIYQLDREAGWGHMRTLPPGTFRSETDTTDTVSTEDSGTPVTSGLLDQAWSDNLNFPLLQSDYTIPSYSAGTNPWTGETIGSSYMPWTTEGMANVPTDARSYAPPELTLEHPSYIGNPLGQLKLPADWEDLLDMGEDEEES